MSDETPPAVAYMDLDGSPHEIGNPACDECAGEPYPCPCGGLIHRQSVYGPSILEWCDRCGDPDKSSA